MRKSICMFLPKQWCRLNVNDGQWFICGGHVACWWKCKLFVNCQWYPENKTFLFSGTTIPWWQYRFPSAQRSQASSGPVSTTVGDHVGIPGVVLLPMTRLMLLVKTKVLTVLLYGKTSILAKEPFSRLLLFSQCSYLQYSTYYSVLTIYYHVGVPFFLLRASHLS